MARNRPVPISFRKSFSVFFSAAEAQSGVAAFPVSAVDDQLHLARLCESPQPAQHLVAVHRSNIGAIRPAGIGAAAGLS
jgi:hypothetical protein